MGYIKEPAGIDFVVDPKALSAADRKRISEIIAYYKATGRKMPMHNKRAKNRSTTKYNKKALT